MRSFFNLFKKRTKQEVASIKKPTEQEVTSHTEQVTFVNNQNFNCISLKLVSTKAGSSGSDLVPACIEISLIDYASLRSNQNSKSLKEHSESILKQIKENSEDIIKETSYAIAWIENLEQHEWPIQITSKSRMLRILNSLNNDRKLEKYQPKDTNWKKFYGFMDNLRFMIAHPQYKPDQRIEYNQIQKIKKRTETVTKVALKTHTNAAQKNVHYYKYNVNEIGKIYEAESIITKCYHAYLGHDRVPSEATVVFDDDQRYGINTTKIAGFKSIGAHLEKQFRNPKNQYKGYRDYFENQGSKWLAGLVDKGLIETLVASYVFEENDLHSDNYGLNKNGEVVRIDLGQSFWPLTSKYAGAPSSYADDLPIAPQDAFPITPDDLRRFPDLKDAKPFFWLVFPQINEKQNQDLRDSLIRKIKATPGFERRKWKAFLKAILMPDALLENISKDSIGGKDPLKSADKYSKHIKQRIAKLKEVLIDMPEFQAFMNDHGKAAYSEIIDEMKEYNSKLKDNEAHLHYDLTNVEDRYKNISNTIDAAVKKSFEQCKDFIRSAIDKGQTLGDSEALKAFIRGHIDLFEDDNERNSKYLVLVCESYLDSYLRLLMEYPRSSKISEKYQYIYDVRNNQFLSLLKKGNPTVKDLNTQLSQIITSCSLVEDLMTLNQNVISTDLSSDTPLFQNGTKQIVDQAKAMFKEGDRLAVDYLSQQHVKLEEVRLLSDTIKETACAVEKPLEAKPDTLFKNANNLPGKASKLKKILGIASIIAGLVVAAAATVLLVGGIVASVPTFGVSLLGVPLAYGLYGVSGALILGGSASLFFGRQKGAKIANETGKAVQTYRRDKTP